MTILLTKCPECDSSFMLLDTERESGFCMQCGKKREFGKSEISDAESRRDSLAEKYLPRLEKAFNEKDVAAMSSLAEEVAAIGLSSWYAWFCVGWYDLHEGRTGEAFDDFKLAVFFLDEENFDEFYEAVMEVVLDSMEYSAKNDRDWSTEDTTLVDFTGSMFERFESLCENGDFMCDLALRIGTLADSMETAEQAADLIKEIMMIVLDYLSGNLFSPDRQTMLNNAVVSVDALGERMAEFSGDGSVQQIVVNTWAPGFSEFIKELLKVEDGLICDFTEEELFILCEYWSNNDYESVFSLIQNAFSFHLGYLMSGGRNKGSKKKRDQALADYAVALRRPMDEGLLDEDREMEEYDRICPDCGKPLTADEDGLMVCDCGFRCRTVTKEIDDLPENIGELVILGRKAYLDRDPKALNNIGEKILDIEHENWHGLMYLATSCLIDGECGEALMMCSQAVTNVAKADSKECEDMALDLMTDLICGKGDVDVNVSMLMMPSFFTSMGESCIDAAGMQNRLIANLMDGDYSNPSRGLAAVMTIVPALMTGLMADTSLNSLRDLANRLCLLAQKVDEMNSAVKKDPSNLKDDVSDQAKILIDLLAHLVSGIDSRIGSMGAEKVGYLAGMWSANRTEYEEMANDVIEAFLDDGSAYNPKSNAIKKSKYQIDRFLDRYVSISGQ